MLRFQDHKQTHNTRSDSSGQGIGTSQRPIPGNTQHSQKTYIHAPRMYWKPLNTSKRAAADLPGINPLTSYCFNNERFSRRLSNRFAAKYKDYSRANYDVPLLHTEVSYVSAVQLVTSLKKYKANEHIRLQSCLGLI